MKNKLKCLLVLPVLFICIIFEAFAEKQLRDYSYLKTENKRVYDWADIMSDYSEERIDNFLKLFHQELDIEFIAVSVENLKGKDIDGWTNQLFQDWQIGSSTKGLKGLLFVVAEEEKQVRLEVGYDLEEIYTDAFVGYIEREQMKPFFENGRIGDGFEATLELIVERAYKNIKEGNYLQDEGKGRGEMQYFSEGAGANENINIGGGYNTANAGDSIKADFKAQDTPEKTFSLYLESARQRIKEYNLGIYTEGTKEFFKNWTVTNAQLDNIVQKFANEPFTLKIEDSYAVIHYPNKDMTYSPFFFEKTKDGWQLDFAAMNKVIHFNHRNQWRFISTDHPYMFAFQDYYIDGLGYVMPKTLKNANDSKVLINDIPVQEIFTEKDQASMVLVHSGEFVMGGAPDIARSNKYFAHKVYLDSYYIDKFEVTSKQYKLFIDDNGYNKKEYWSKEGWEHKEENNLQHPKHWFGEPNSQYEEERQIPSEFDHPDYPVRVTFYETEAYAKWAGKRLPTEAEWEKAARGIDERMWSWGNNFEPSIVNYADQSKINSYRYVSPVGTFDKDRSPYGVQDMFSNYWEWCSDYWDPDYYKSSPYKNPKGPKEADSEYGNSWRLIRGGNFYRGAPYVTAAYRYASQVFHTSAFRTVKEAK